MQHFPVKSHEDGTKLMRWVKARFPHITRGLLEKGIRKGWIKVDKKKPTANDVLNAGQNVSLAEYLCEIDNHNTTAHTQKTPAFAGVNAKKQFRNMIIFENEELVAINKPAGLAVQGGSKQKVSVDVLAKSIADENQSLRLVHRLDKDTSGVLLLAKTAKAATRLTKLFAGKEVEKQYTALVVGVPKPHQGKVDAPLAKAVRGKDSRMEKVDVDMLDGKQAVTLYEVINHAAQRYAWVRLTPITGRTHQLRVHMAEIGYPIVGDGKYGGARAFRAGDNLAKQLHLHAASITLPDVKGKPLTIKADMPEHMQQAWGLLGGD